jgi:hypothetical protein
VDVWKYFLLTIVIELPVIAVWLDREWKRSLKIGFLLNLFTWPLIMLLAREVGNIPLLELGVAIVEGIGYQLFFRKGWVVSLLMSLLVNGLSYGISFYIKL